MSLPWAVGCVGLLVYLITLNKWVSLYSIGTVASVSGWEWRPELSQPLVSLVLYPFHQLPERWIPVALNLFVAVCAALVLVLLARSVVLLRHHLPPDDPFCKTNETLMPSMPAAWIPPVLAGIVCGLQLSFWEHATSFTGEMIDLLVFAYVIRCLIEFRVSQDESWLVRCGLVYAAGMANNWALIGYLPIFVAALLWVTSFGLIYNKRLLLRIALSGMAGLSLYLLLPVLHRFSSNAQMDFWTALKTNLKHQRDALSLLRQPALRILALTLLLPLLILSVRWKSHTVQAGDDSRLGVFLTRATGHLVHGLFLVISIWIGLDPAISPRHLNLGTPMLTYYYMSSLIAGYCAGYFLLFGIRSSPPTGLRITPSLARWNNHARMGAVAAVWVLVFALPVALGWRNLGQISLTNGPALHEFAGQLYADLPEGKSVVLSDDPDKLALLRVELAAHGGGALEGDAHSSEKDALLLEKRALTSGAYQRLMAARFSSRWPLAVPTKGVEVIEPVKVLKLIADFAARETVVHLQAGFGPLAEGFVYRPKGLIYVLERRSWADGPKASSSGSSPFKEDEIIKSEMVRINEQIWQERWMQTLQVLIEKEKPNEGILRRCLRLAPSENLTALVLGAAYAKSLNYWGVQLQRLGRWDEAGVWFRRAVELNPENLAALINLQYNEQCQQGDKRRLEGEVLQKRFHDFSGKYDNWLEMLNVNGPVDEPTVLFKIARALLAASDHHQAAREFARCAELAPEWQEPRVWLVLSYIDLRQFGKALEVADRIQAASPPQDGTRVSELLLCRTTALRGLGRTNEAAACIESFVWQYRGRGEVLSIAADIYAQNLQFEEALMVLDELLKDEPANLKALATKGWAELELCRYSAAIETLNRVVSHAPSDENARLNLAIARLSAGELDAGGADYQALLKTIRNSKNALFELGGIAWRKHDTNTAIGFYEQCLLRGSPGSRQYLVASERLKQVQQERAQAERTTDGK